MTRALPPKPLPVTPTYRDNAVFSSLKERIDAETRQAVELTPRGNKSLRCTPPAAQQHASPFRGSREHFGVAVQPQVTQSQRKVVMHREYGSHRERCTREASPSSLRGQEKSSMRCQEGRDAERPIPENRTLSGSLRARSVDASTRNNFARATIQNGGGNAFQPQRRAAPPSSVQDTLPEEEASEYSDRFLEGYERGRLLGRGACAVVWLAQPSGQQGFVAVKQVAKGTTGKKRSDTEAAKKEIMFGSVFFHAGGDPKVSPTAYPGVLHIAKMFNFFETKRDIWIVMEYGGTCLTKMAYEIKGEFLRGERLYRVSHLPLLQSMKQDSNVLKGMLRQLLSALWVLSDHNVVHSDIKPDNILIDEDEHGLRCRLIDLGSAFDFDCPEKLALATPEYMPPEALETCAAWSCGTGRMARVSMPSRVGFSGGLANTTSRRKSTDPASKLHRPSQPWSFDVWSLGSILLELCVGTPLWLSYKCRVADGQSAQNAATGLFAVPGRTPDKIIAKQHDVLRHRGLQNVLRGAQGVPINEGDVDSGMDVLSMMLTFDPMERISPSEALDHPWLHMFPS